MLEVDQLPSWPHSVVVVNTATYATACRMEDESTDCVRCDLAVFGTQECWYQ